MQDGILVVSLGSPAVMRFKRVCTAAQCPHCSVLDAQYVQHASEHSPDDALQTFGSAHDNIKQCQNAKDGECLDSGPCCIVPQGQTISMQHTAGQHASSSCFASSHCHRHGNGCSSGIMCSSHFSMLLQGGDVLALSGAARYCWSHGINSTHVESMTHGPLAAANDVAAVAAEGGAHAAALHADVSAGGVVVRGVRVSITLRRMCLDASGSIMLHHEHLA